jgi:hypothetical protein
VAKRRRKTKQKVEFSKKILLFAAVINLVVIVFTLVVVWRTCDLSPLAYLIPSVADRHRDGFLLRKGKGREPHKTHEAEPFRGHREHIQ